LPFTLLAPSNTTLFPWASADLDGDGIINGYGEGFASSSSDARITTAETSMSGIDLEYTCVEEWDPEARRGLSRCPSVESSPPPPEPAQP
jgi:hypothetical protein